MSVNHNRCKCTRRLRIGNRDPEEKATQVRGEIEELNVLAAQIKEKETVIRDIVDQLSSLLLWRAITRPRTFA